MYDEQLENLIEAALIDGELSEKEKQILFKKAQSMGVDLDEFEMVLNARLVKLKKAEADKVQTTAPKSNKLGDIKKCPACGALISSFQTSCPECGYEFRNVEAVASAQKLFDQLQDIEMHKAEKLAKNEEAMQQKLSELAKFHSSERANMVFGRTRRIEAQEDERAEVIGEMKKQIKIIEKEALSEKHNLIKHYPVPNTKEDLLELLTMSASNAYDNDGFVGEEEEVWIQKVDQIYQKVLLTEDEAIISKASMVVTSLMRRLPLMYRNFTQLPPAEKAKWDEEHKNPVAKMFSKLFKK